MITAEIEEYGFLPLVIGGAVIAGGLTGYMLGRKGKEDKYYECLTYQTKKGIPVEKAEAICSEPFRKPSLFDYLIGAPLLLGIGYFIFKSVRGSE